MTFALTALAVVASCALAARWLHQALPRQAALAASLGVLVAALGVPAFLTIDPLFRPAAPLHPHGVDYSGSSTCRTCHADNHASWHATYHRTMTQEASPSSVRGAFDGATRTFKEVPIRPAREGERFVLDVDGQRRTVDRVVGSHEHQVYLSREPDGRYVTLPLEWNIRRGRWLTSDASFLAPETDLWGSSRPWATTCSPCHNTRAVPGRTVVGERVEWRTELAEMGIACEACHGPGEQHEAANRNPMRRVLLALRSSGDPTIVNPARLGQMDSLRACGRCHGKWWPKREEQARWLESGEIYRPGAWGLEEHYTLGPRQDGTFREEQAGGWWWPDGTPRASAMEYQGVLASPCFRGGEMTCLSCHSMHGADPTDQLVHVDDPATAAREDDRACTQCHAAFLDPARLVAHTHHEAASSGSRCVGCHMPYQTWGILKAIRSHRVSSPDAAASAATRIPNGCNDCHVDRPLAWTADRLHEWYDHPEPELRDVDGRWSATVIDLIEGHALSRALAATSLGRAESFVTSPTAWRATFLAFTLLDPYPAVRWAGLWALRGLPGSERFDTDHLAPAEQRLADMMRLRREAAALATAAGPPPAGVPLRADGYADRKLVNELLAHRSHARIAIRE